MSVMIVDRKPKRLCEISQIFSGYAFRSQDFGDKGIPVIKIANIQNKLVNPECLNLLPEELCISKLNRYFLRPEDTLIAMTGAGSVGKVGKMPSVKGRFLVNQRVAIVRPDSAKCDPAFVYYALSQDFYETKLYGLGLGAGQPNVSAKQIGELEVPFPPLPVQQRIAGILSAYDELIENSQQRIKILETMARNLYREWFVHFRFPGHESHPRVASPLARIPQGWEAVTFGELYNTSSGGTPSRKKPEYFKEGTTDWVKSQELLDDFILLTEERITDAALKNSSAKVFPANTVLIALYGATIGKLGILASEAATNQACCAVLPKDSMFGREFAFLTLLQNRERIIGLRLGAAQQNISQVLLRNLECIKPPGKLVGAFTEKTSPLLNGILIHQQRVEKLRRTRDLLLPRLLSGQVPLDAMEP